MIMDYIIQYWKEKETNPVEFINHFRCTTNPIGGGTEHDDDGELVNYEAAIAAISIAKKELINKACEWLDNNKHLHKELSFGSLSTDWNKFIKEFKKAMEE